MIELRKEVVFSHLYFRLTARSGGLTNWDEGLIKFFTFYPSRSKRIYVKKEKIRKNPLQFIFSLFQSRKKREKEKPTVVTSESLIFDLYPLIELVQYYIDGLHKVRKFVFETLIFSKNIKFTVAVLTGVQNWKFIIYPSTINPSQT